MSKDKKQAKVAYGIDIGGSGIKGALVNLKDGSLASDRIRIATPQPATPEAVTETVAELLARHEVAHDVPVGITYPGVVTHGVTRTAANVDKSWIGANIEKLVEARTGHTVLAMNDADAAGYAETVFGAVKGVDGVTIVVTLGTGIGTAIIVNGTLLPNTEIGHIEIDGQDAEVKAAASVKDIKGISYEEWGADVNRYLQTLEALFWPDRFVIGGGVSSDHAEFFQYLDLRAEVVPAELRNKAGIVGAAALAASGVRL